MESGEISREACKFLEQFKFTDEKKKQCRILTYSKGEFLYMAEMKWDYVMIILSGKAKVCSTTESGRTLLSCIYENEGVLGDVELLGERMEAMTTVEAITAVTAVGIPANLCRKECKENVDFVYSLGKELSIKLQNSGMNAVASIMNPLESRLCDFIYQTQVEGHFETNLTELSQILGTSYRHLLRTLENLKEDEIIKKEKRGYQVLNIQELRNRCKLVERK